MSVLYVWIRSDLDSMNLGKACAQVAHAASQAAALSNSAIITAAQKKAYKEWENSAAMEARINDLGIGGYDGFGTTIVLDGGTGNDLLDIHGVLEGYDLSLIHGLVTDPSYPVRDGGVTWGVKADTCVWAFVHGLTHPDAIAYIKSFNLR